MSYRTTLDQQHSTIEAAHNHHIILNSREIFLSGEVDDEGELGRLFLTNMQILLARSHDKPIIIHQYSIGGDWCTGMMIFDSIITCPCPIIFVCHGLAASMGSIIPMACTQHEDSYCVSMPNCWWLIHDGESLHGEGHTYKQGLSWHEFGKLMKNQMMEWYVQACKKGIHFEGKSEKQILNILQKHLDAKEDWILNAKEAVEYGFCDAVLGDENFESLDEIRSHWPT